MVLMSFCVFVQLFMVINCNLIASKRTSAKLNGDYKIGVLVSVHHQPTHKKGRFLECGLVSEKMFGKLNFYLINCYKLRI